ncbi:3-oxoacyl-ACP reductase family protein [Clostridium fungisolvens]|uniref:3-oxoacyl-[acyl-carrier-protein] reductase FabG n=1 Tax=Clostridium fungisolvens TaxID=1604897 RepID=A0A6V8SKI1_9CLOT|nr:3-oxoacyl-ACP reductase family protein [Clostridium fungisolvens]GFP77739.1 3-oxoacyl-[acyl-carrier-protein] reductase FabG [Clostridium fungisolvens]
MDRKTAVVTGASRGIGRACAIKLAQRGMNVVVNYNKSEKKALEVIDIIREFGVEAIAVKADISINKEVVGLFSQAMKHFGRVDILVNNVGIVEDSFIMMLSEDSLNRSMDINIKSYFYCCKQAALKMFKNKKGCIVNISSVSSRKALAGQSVYSATKGAINSMTAVLAKELSQFGICVNSIAPGFINTDMISSLSEDKKKEYLDMIPLGRFGEAEEVAELVSFLCEGRGSYITGQTFVIDGGLSI